MKSKLWFNYFLYIFLIIVLVLVGQQIFWDYKRNVQDTFNYRPYYQYTITMIFYMGLGILLGVEHIICEIKKKGTWSINIPKIILMGIPSLYFSLVIFIYYSNIPILSYPYMVLIKGGTNFINAFEIVLGYSVITSFYKASENNKSYW